MEKKLYFDIPQNRAGLTACIFMLLSAGIRISAFCLPSANLSAFSVATQLVLPLLANLTFVFFISYGRNSYTVFAMALGVAFFVCRIFYMDVSAVQRALCCCLYAAVLTVYSLTLFGVIRVRWPLTTISAAALIYHIAIEFIVLLIVKADTVSLQAVLAELSVESVIASLLCTAVAFKKRV